MSSDSYRGDGVFSRPYEPHYLNRSRAEPPLRMRKMSGGEMGDTATRIRIKQELDLIPERVKMEPGESLEYYYSSAGAPHYSVNGAPLYATRPLTALSPPRRSSLPYRPEDYPSFADGGGSTACVEPPVVDPPQQPLHFRRHSEGLVALLHLKEEVQEEVRKSEHSPEVGVAAPPLPLQEEEPEPELEEEEFRDRSGAGGSSRTVIGGLSGQRGCAGYMTS